MMKLFLASRFNNPLTIKKLDDFLGGIKGKKIAYIPTAANGEEGWEYWKTKEGGSWQLVNTLGAEVKAVVLEEFGNESVVNELKGQDVIFFAGGMPGYLMYWIKRCGLDLHIKELLNDGALYFGTSAGAMVAGKTLDIASWGFVDSERGASDIKPMNLVDFDMFPHYEDEMFDKIKERYQGNKLYLLKDGEEIIVEDSKVTLIGDERIIKND